MAVSPILAGIGERLYRQRKKLKMTQEEVAELLEMSAPYYGELERGKKRISIEKILLAYERLELDPTYLLTGERISEKSRKEMFQGCPREKRQTLEQILTYISELWE